MKQFLCFKIRGYWFGMDVENVIEIVNPTSLSNADSPAFPGEDNIVYHGATLPTIHLEDLLFGEQVKYDTSKRILVSEINALRAGIIVDSAEEILSVGNDQIRKLTPGLTPINYEYLEGYIPSEERNIFLISSEKLGELVSAK
ncbi:MAG: chemotaxis protein CheW [Candidatus Zixiibacteriota bacterium]